MNTVFERQMFSVNSKRLATTITDFIEQGFESVEVHWASEVHRNSFVEVIEEWLQNDILDDAQEITHFKVLCDDRNNTTESFEQGVFNLEIQYKQKNCYNTSRIIYHITEKTEK